MAHNINRMVFAGATPWHGIGTRLPANATFEQVYHAAGFYEAKEAPAFIRHGNSFFPVPDRKVIVRADMEGTGAYLQTAGRDYTICQFSDLAKVVVDACGGMEAVIHTAGTLGENGGRGWILAELPEQFTFRVPGDDTDFRPYVLAATSHDGTLATHIRNCLTRVVCQNTLGAALGERGGASWSIKHTKNAGLKLEDAGRALAEMGQRNLRFGQLAAEMAKIRLTNEAFEAAIAAAIPIKDDGEKHPQLEADREEIRSLRETFTGATPAIIGTAWGDFQALTEALDWGRRSESDTARNAEASTLGANATAKARGLELLLQGTGLSLKKVAGE